MGLQADLARALLTEFPDAPTRQLARMLRDRHPAVYVSENAARQSVKTLRGANGDSRRKDVRNRMPRSHEDATHCERWGSLVPPADSTGFKWHTLSEVAKRYLIICDLHVPYHDRKAVMLALQHARGTCDGLLILGDLVDAYQLSTFQKDPRRRNHGGEVTTVNRLLDGVDSLDFKEKIWKFGNHDFRLERYLMTRAPEIPDLSDKFSYRTECNLDERGWKIVPPGHPLRHRHLTLIHGHEWGNRFSNPVNQARGAFLKATDCTIEGHGHRTSSHTEVSITGRVIQNWSVGCLCSLNPEYRPMGSKWNLGFAVLNTGSEWSVENYRIINNKVY